MIRGVGRVYDTLPIHSVAFRATELAYYKRAGANGAAIWNLRSEFHSVYKESIHVNCEVCEWVLEEPKPFSAS